MTIIAQTTRLALLAPAREHYTALFAVFGNAEAMRHIGDGTAWPEERVSRLVDEMIDLQAERGFSLWPLARRDTGEVIGDCGLCFIRNSESGERGPEIELGYHLRPDAWGQGFATEAASAALGHAFDTLALPRILAVVRPENTPSQRVLEKCGMQREGETQRYYDKTLVLFSKTRA